MDSLGIKEAEAEIVGLINGIGLPLEVKRLILVEIVKKVEEAAEQEIDSLLEARKDKKDGEEGGSGDEQGI